MRCCYCFYNSPGAAINDTTLTGTALGTDIAAGKEFTITADKCDIWFYGDTAASGQQISTVDGYGGAISKFYSLLLPAGSSTPPITFATVFLLVNCKHRRQYIRCIALSS